MKKITFTTLIIFLLSLARVHADIVEVTPFLKLSEEYDDNLFYSFTDSKDDFITTLSPGIKAKRATERFNMRGSGEIGLRSYLHETELNSVDQQYEGAVEYKLTPLLTLNTDGSFTRDARADRDIGTTGLTQGTTKRDRISLGGGGNYILDEKTNLSGQYTLLRDSFDDPAFSDSNTHDLQLGATRNLDPYFSLTTGRLLLGYSRYNFIGSQTQNYSLTIGAKRRLSELLSFLVDVGGRYSHAKTWGFRNVISSTPPIVYERLISPEIVEKTWGGIGQATVSYAGEKNDWDLSVTHDLQPASGRNGATERTRLFLGVTRKFTSELRGRIETEFYLNKTEAKNVYSSDLDTETFELRPQLIYQFSRDLSFVTLYRYTYYADKEAGKNLDKNYFVLRLDYQYPLFD